MNNCPTTILVRRFHAASALLACSLLLSILVPTATADDAEDYERIRRIAVDRSRQTIRKLIAEQADAVVTIKFILRHSLMGEESKDELETTGVMLSPEGLVLGANSTMTGLAEDVGDYYSELGPGSGGSTADTVDYRITIGSSTEELPARLVARESELDLAWLQITDTKGRSFRHVDFAAGTRLEVGDRYLTLLRLGDRFERAPVVYDGAIGGEIQRPRPLLVAGFGLAPGSVLFDADGRAAGLVIAQPPEKGDPGAMSEDYMSAAATFVLPAARVVEAMANARQAIKAGPAQTQPAGNNP